MAEPVEGPTGVELAQRLESLECVITDKFHPREEGEFMRGAGVPRPKAWLHPSPGQRPGESRAQWTLEAP